MKYFIFIIFLFISNLTYSQINLVIDGSFEDTVAGWQDFYTNHKAIKNWKTPDSTKDRSNLWALFSTKRNNIFAYGMLPNNIFVKSYPKSGHGAIYFVPYIDTLHGWNLKSVLCGKLHQKLIAGKQYCATIYATAEERHGFTVTNGIGMYFDDGSLNDSVLKKNDSTGSYTWITPQVQCNFFINDTANWMKIQGTFIANGTEDKITIANFLPDSTLMRQKNFGLYWNVFGQNILLDQASLLPTDINNWLTDYHAPFGADSFWVGLDPLDYVEGGTWFTANGQFITNAPGFWIYKADIEAGTKYIHEIEVCGAKVRDTTTLYIAPVAIGNVQKQNTIHIYPNPATSKINIEAKNNATPKAICISNIFGKKVYEGTLQTNQELDVSSWSRGVYFVKVGSEVYNIYLQ
jgi:hypothetical protein